MYGKAAVQIVDDSFERGIAARDVALLGTTWCAAG